MAPKPLTLFVCIATASSRFFQAGAERPQASSPVEISSRKGPTAQFLANAAMVCMAPVCMDRLLGQPAARITVALLSAWLLWQVFGLGGQLVSPAGQPTKGACSVKFSPHKGLASFSPQDLCMLPSYVWQLCRRIVQRRRLYVHAILAYLDGILSYRVGSPSASDVRRATCDPGSHGLHDFHEALPMGFLMPLQVAACRTQPEVSVMLQRLLADRLWELENPQPALESVPEDEYVMWNPQLDDPLA